IGATPAMPAGAPATSVAAASVGSTVTILGPQLSTPDPAASPSDQTGSTGPSQAIVRVKDVARVELGAQQYDQTATLDGKPTVALTIYGLPGANAIDTAEGVYRKMEELKRHFPEDVTFEIVYDTTPFIRESVNEVFKTLRDAVILVALVVLVFLQSW